MELIPIAYTVLIAAAILAIIVIAWSYISLRIKQKDGGSEPASSSAIKIHNGVKTEPTIKNAITRITKPLFSAGVPKQKEISAASKNISSDYGLTSKIGKTESSNSKRNIGSLNQSNRVVVMNDSKSTAKNAIHKNSIPPTNRKNDNLKSLDEDLLGKYADENNDSMFTLNVKNNKDNWKK